MKYRNLLALVLSLALGSVAFAGEMKHPAGFKFWAPDGWKSTTDGMNVELRDPAGEVLVALFTPANVSQIDAALKELDKNLARWLTDIKVGTPEKGTEEGVDYAMVEGTGKVNGKPVNVAVGVFHSEGEVLLAFAAVDAAAKTDHEATIEKIIDSIE